MKEILSHQDIVSIEKFNLQRGMNFRPKNRNYSILLMSVRENAPFNDGFGEDGKVLIYEGENVIKRELKRPKEFDQPLFTKGGKLTNNAKFFKAAEDYKLKRREKPEKVRVYEKIKENIWTDKGWFYLVDAKIVDSKEEKRKVFKFILEPIKDFKIKDKEELEDFEFSRRISTEVKIKVWERDGGKCKKCGSTRDLHFDHIIPWSKGGSSRNPRNIQILCGRCNIKKSNRIE